MVGVSSGVRALTVVAAVLAATAATLLLVVLPARAASVFYVDAFAGGADDGSSWSDAYTDLQTAIDKAADAGGGQVWVRASNYSPGASAGDSFVMGDGVELYGGFAGSETSIDQRDWLNLATVLTGNGVNNHVVDVEGTSNTRVDGFVVIQGYADGATTQEQNGGGYYARGAVDAVLANVAFDGNGAINKGGAIFVDNEATLDIVNVGFYNNFTFDTTGTTGNGGAIFAGSDAVVGIVNSYFYNNNADGEGGAIFNAVAETKVSSSTLRSNFADGLGEAIRNNTAGGAIDLTNTIVWNAGIGGAVISGAVTADHSNIDGGFTGAGNIDADPIFTQTTQPFVALNSPVINVGTNATVLSDQFDVDHDGDTSESTPTIWETDRIRGQQVDIGAVETVCADTIFVDESSAAGLLADGGSWATAFPDLQDGLQLARDCAPWVTDIHVANGTYKPHPTDPNVSFELVDNVTITGGFPSGGATNPIRPVSVWNTILEGDLADNDPGTAVVSPAHTNPSDPLRQENSKRVVVADGVTGTGLVNVRVNGGNANFGTINSGGGVYIDQSEVTLRRVQVTENTATNGGAGVDVFFNSDVKVLDSEVLSNHAVAFAGGIDVNTSVARVVTSRIADNSAGSNGAGIRTLSGELVIENTEIVRNEAADGAGMSLIGSGEVKVVNSTIASNTATVSGGAVEIDEGFPIQPAFTMVNSIVWGNTAPLHPNLDPEALAGAIDYSIVEGGAVGTDNLDVDPDFINAPADHQVPFSSPATNTGDDASAPVDDLDIDQDGSTVEFTPTLLLLDRIQVGTVDRGAWETTCPTLTTIHADESATGGNNGISWADAYTDLQDALTHARLCPSVDRIEVAEGTYVPDGSDPTVSFELVDGVDLVGGFSAGGSVSPDPESNVTILSGDLLGNDNGSQLASEPTRSENTDVLVRASGGADTSISGFTIEGAVQSSGDADGAALLVQGSSTELAASDLLITDTTAQEIVTIEFGTLRLTRSEMAQNFSGGGFIGGISVRFAGTADVSHVHVHHNTQRAFNVDQAQLRLSNVLIHDQSGFAGGAVRAKLNATVVIDSSTIVDNTRSGGTGSAGVQVDSNAALVAVRNSIIRGNTIDGGLLAGNITVGTNVTVTESNVEGGFAGTGNLDADPNFVNPTIMDFRLRSGSPSLDAGKASLLPADFADVDGDGDLAEVVPTDLAGEDRVQDGETDQGAYEGAVSAEGVVIFDDPCVVYDSTAASGGLSGTFEGGETRTIQVTDSLTGQGGASTCVPKLASAAIFRVSSVDPLTEGNVRMVPSGEDVAGGAGVVNYGAANGLNNANTVTVPLSASGAVDVEANAGPAGAVPTTDVRLTVIGYYSPTVSADLRFVPLTPCAVADSRPNKGADDVHDADSDDGFWVVGEKFPDIDVVGDFPAGQGGNNGVGNPNGNPTSCGVPVGADYVLVNVVAIAPQGGSGFLSIGKGGVDPIAEVTTPFAPLSPGMANGATGIVDVSSGLMALDIDGDPAAKVRVRVEVLGYFDEDPSGLAYTPVTPCTAFDSRANKGATGSFAGLRKHGQVHATVYQIAGDGLPVGQGKVEPSGSDPLTGTCGVPDGSAAVLINLEAVNAVREGNFWASEAGVFSTGGVLNFNDLTPKMNNANAVVVPLDALGRLQIEVNAGSFTAVGTEVAHARGVILGYYN